MEGAGNPQDIAGQAIAAYQAGDYDRAAQDFSTASELFENSGDQLRAAEMRNNLCVCLLQLDRPHEALEAVRDTPTIFHNEDALSLKAQALGNRAMAKAALSLASEAEADYRAAADLFRQLDEQEGLQYTMQALSRMQLQQGRPMEALHAMQSVLDAKARPSLRDRILKWLFEIPQRFVGRG